MPDINEEINNSKEDKIEFDYKNIKSSETYTLPSKGLIYRPEDNIPASITLRRMTTKEDKMRLRNEEEDIIRKEILQACIVGDDIQVGRLKLMDANFLLFKLRILSLLDDKYKITCGCHTCGVKFIHEINLNEVPIKYFDAADLDKFNIKLPVSGYKLDFKYPSIDDMIDMRERLSDYFERFPKADKGEVIYNLTALLYIDKVNDKKLMIEELEDFIDNLDIIDSRAMKDAIVTNIDNLYGFTTAIKTRCPNCGTEIEHGLPITAELFSPSK